MLLSAVSVLVVVQSSSEMPEGLTTLYPKCYPCLIYRVIHANSAFHTDIEIPQVDGNFRPNRHSKKGQDKII